MAAWRPSWIFDQHEFQLGPTRHQGALMCKVSEHYNGISHLNQVVGSLDINNHGGACPLCGDGSRYASFKNGGHFENPSFFIFDTT